MVGRTAQSEPGTSNPSRQQTPVSPGLSKCPSGRCRGEEKLFLVIGLIQEMKDGTNGFRPSDSRTESLQIKIADP